MLALLTALASSALPFLLKGVLSWLGQRAEATQSVEIVRGEVAAVSVVKATAIAAAEVAAPADQAGVVAALDKGEF